MGPDSLPCLTLVGIVTMSCIIEDSVLDSRQGQDTYLLSMQAGCHTYPTSHPMGTSCSVPGVKQPRREDGRSFVSSA